MNKHLGIAAALFMAALGATASAATAPTAAGAFDAASMTGEWIQLVAATTSGQPKPKPRPRPNGSQTTVSVGGVAVLA